MDRNFYKVIGLKVDVDTYQGMKKGVPALLGLLRKFGIKATFFVPMGKDHTGWTVKRIFARKGFLRKAGRVGVIKTYGIRTLMHGLLLPGPEIAKRNKETLNQIITEGHELGIHGYDHVSWHDNVREWNETKTEEVLNKACTVFEEILGQRALSFAAPGWMINPHALNFFEKRGFLYSSDTRGSSPFVPDMGGRQLDILQIPTTLPTLDEVVGIAANEPVSLVRHFIDLLDEGLNILTVHAELEGNRWIHFLESFMQKTRDQGFTYSTLMDIAQKYQKCNVAPRCRVAYGNVEGRAGTISCQKLPSS